MSFLFKSKKAPPPGLTSATRDVHTSDGTPQATGLTNGFPEKSGSRGTEQTSQNASVNNSLNSLPENPARSDAQWARRDRADSDIGTRRAPVNGQVPNAALYPWSQRQLDFPTPNSNVFPRYGAAVNAVASKDGDIYMMGGLINGSMVKGDLWIVESNTSGMSCYPIATVSEGPGPRVGHASLLVGNAFIVFGGDTKMEDSDELDDTLYLLNTTSRQWSRAVPPGPRPAGRYGHTLNILGSRIYIFGGQVEGYFFNDLVAYDLNALQNPNNQWEFLLQNTAEGGPEIGKVPSARTNHSIISYNDQLYLFGGTNGAQWFNDVWTYDPYTNSWTQQDCIGYIPAPREGHSAALVNDVMYIFGGRTEEGTDLGDLAAFRISSRRWYTFQNMGPSPSPRSGHSMTAHGKQIVVLGGEPSSAPRDTGELSLVYVLDTAKIRYPNDPPSGTQASKSDLTGGPIRSMSNDKKMATVGSRSASRQAQDIHPDMSNMSKQGSAARDAPSAQFATTNRSVDSNAMANAAGPRVPRASVAQAPAGPPPQNQAPNPKLNGVTLVREAPRSKTPTEGRSAGPPLDTIRAMSSENQRQSPTTRESPREPPRVSREASPGAHGRRTPTGPQPVSKAKAMEAGEAAPLMSGGPSRQRSQRSQRGQGSIDGSEEGLLGRAGSGSGRVNSDGAGSLRSVGDEPRSPRLTPHQEALVKELEALKSRNAWYASELALARKAGYQSAASASPTFDDRAVNQFGDDDKPMIEAFLAMRAELVRMQQTVESQAASAAKRVADVEHQRDAAVSEAAYARAKLAAHSGSQSGTPQSDTARDIDDHPERTTDISRRLALALAAQNEQKAKMEALANELAAERRARDIADESADAAHKRLDEIGEGRNPMEAEGLRAELHEVQRLLREESGQRAQVEEKLRMLLVDNDELTGRHGDVSTRLADHVASLSALQAAVTASSNRTALVERQLEEERQQRDAVERKLQQLRAEHEERTTELENTSRRLRDAEELAETHAIEATTHREALLAGISKAAVVESPRTNSELAEQRISVLQQSTDRAHANARANQEAADQAAQKLRSAEERIAGLEAYQEQTSREGLQIRRQLQAALKDLQSHQAENRELTHHLEASQRDHSALAVQHGALKDLLGERGVNMSDARKSPLLDNHSPSSRFGTPEQNRLRELEQQLQSSLKAHEETKHSFESREQEADRNYREKIEQLENDYQSAVHYVKGTEKMLKRMKDELSKYKTQNTQLKTDLDAAKGRARGVSDEEATEPAAWHAERETLQMSIEDIRSQTSSQIAALEANMTALQRALADAKAERDEQKSSHAELAKSTERSQKELGQLQSENAMLEARAQAAEQRVTMLLDQVGQSVGNYRRQSHIAAVAQHHGGGAANGGPNGAHHTREQSDSTMASQAESSSPGEGAYNDARGSLALDNLASELDALRSHWESTNRSYRLSSQFDFERTPTKETEGGDLTDSLASWRKRLDEEEKGDGNGGGGGAVQGPNEAGGELGGMI